MSVWTPSLYNSPFCGNTASPVRCVSIQFQRSIPYGAFSDVFCLYFFKLSRAVQWDNASKNKVWLLLPVFLTPPPKKKPSGPCNFRDFSSWNHHATLCYLVAIPGNCEKKPQLSAVNSGWFESLEGRRELELGHHTVYISNISTIILSA